MAKDRKVKIFDPKIWLFNFVKATAAFPVLISERLKKLYIGGKKPNNFSKGRFIICANHVSYWDPMVVCTLFWNRRVQFIATKELFGNKISNWFFKRVGAIKVDRENININTFKEAKKALDRGHLISIFPEASISSKTSIRKFNSGVALMSILCESQVLPVYIAPRKKNWKRRVVVVGDRIDPKQYINGDRIPTLNEVEHLTNVIRKQEIRLKEVYDSWAK